MYRPRFSASTATVLATWAALLGAAAMDATAFRNEARAAEPLTLVDDGRPCCLIMASQKIAPSEQFAVAELRDFLERISGVKVPVYEYERDIPADKSAVWIVVGKSTAEQRHQDLRLDALGAEGFVVKTVGNDLVLAGGEKRGTLYSVYSFLESLGCRWWSDDADTIPKRNTIRVPATDRREMPKLEYRGLLYQEQWSVNLWSIRNRIAGGGKSIRAEWGGSGPVFHSNLVHAWRTLIKLDGTIDIQNATGKADPRWYALRPNWQGKMQRSTVQPCARNPQVREAILAGAIKFLRRYPEDVFVTVGPEDGPDYCHCTEYGCADLTAKEGSASALVLDIANEAADRVAKEFPGKFVMAPAYAWGIKLPRTMRPRGNVMVSLAPSNNDFGHPVATGVHEKNVQCRAAMEDWARVSKRIWIWDYTTNFAHYLMPHPNLDVLTPNVKYYADHNATGYMAQGSHTCINAEFARLRMWVLAKAMWNPDADNGALVSEFCKGYYGAAGPAILKYIDAVHEPVRRNVDLYVPCNNDFGVPWLAPGVLTEAEAHMREAEAAVANEPALLERVRLAHVPLQYVLAVRQPTSETWRRIDRKLGRVDPVAFANSLADVLDRFFTKSGKPRGMNELGGHKFADFSGYLRQWAAKCGPGPDGDALPPELRGVADRYRLIHPWQIEQQQRSKRSRLLPDLDASDGWTASAKDENWTTQYGLVAEDDYTPGKRYTLFVRVKCPQPTTDGDAFSCGIHGKAPLPSVKKTIATQSLTPGAYQVMEIGTIELRPGHYFWIALAKRNGKFAVSQAQLDCFWLREAPP